MRKRGFPTISTGIRSVPGNAPEPSFLFSFIQRRRGESGAYRLRPPGRRTGATYSGDTMSTSGLLSPITINTLVVRNRAVMPSMLTNFATRGGDVTERLIHYYAERAKGGVGLVSIEGTAVEPRGTAFIRGISAADDSKIKGLSKLARAIKAHGARASCNSSTAGAASIRPFPGSLRRWFRMCRVSATMPKAWCWTLKTSNAS